MHFSTAFKFAALAAPVLFQSAAGWSFTMYDTAGCPNSTLSAADRVEKTGNVTCDPVPNANRHKSVLGAIPAGSECRISFYPRAGCGDRVAFGLTQYTTTCLSINDFVEPLAYYKAANCA
ncbi:hypothetical protein F5Y05DRAFT_391334 [Hypoxylon sp. FL0543]|nr:hypothetical protein F5Y05DRAFT_391334 [Hypoxylon sp. FL0543]